MRGSFFHPGDRWVFGGRALAVHTEKTHSATLTSVRACAHGSCCCVFQECLSQCEGGASSSAYLDFCGELLSHMSSISRKMQKGPKEEVEALFPEEEEEEEEVGQLEGGLPLPVELQQFDHMTRALGVKKRHSGGTKNQLNTGFQSQKPLSLEDKYEEEAEEEEGPADMAATGQGDHGLSLSKRFGGFVKGRHGYRKLAYPRRTYQKRYGGFIGIRKSARKWNNQKRFGEFLKQYLGMSARAPAASSDLGQHSPV